MQDRDLGNNFFLETASLGLPRAQCVAGLLKELNESVSASFAEEVPAHLIVANPDFFKAFDVVIATQVSLQCCLWHASSLWRCLPPIS